MELYKLTRGNRTTFGGMKWRKGQTNRAKARGTELCTEAVLHAYRTPEMAVFFDSIHGGFLERDYRMCIVEGDVVADDGTKVGCKEQTVIRWLNASEIPTMTIGQRVEIGIRCAMKAYNEVSWTRWAELWLSGEERRNPPAARAFTWASYSVRAGAFAAAHASHAAAHAASHANFASIAAAHAACSSAASESAINDTLAVSYRATASKGATNAACEAILHSGVDVNKIILEVMKGEKA